MNNSNFKINIPCDSDGYIGLKCNRCNEDFMIDAIDYRKNYRLVCPNCGLSGGIDFSNNLNDYINDKISNYAIKQINETVKDNCKGIFSFDEIDEMYERNVYYNNNMLEEFNLPCCNKKIKINKIFSIIGIFCPFCKERIYDTK